MLSTSSSGATSMIMMSIQAMSGDVRPDPTLCGPDPNLDIKVVFDKMESFRIDW